VSEDAGEETFGIASVEGVDVGVAEGVGDYFDAYFACFGRVDGDGFEG
jgi:hypothetical protein